MQEHSNKVLIVAIVCVIIGVVVGSVLMKGNTMGSLKGQALDSRYADTALDIKNDADCADGMIWDGRECVNGTIGGGEKVGQLDSAKVAAMKDYLAKTYGKNPVPLEEVEKAAVRFSVMDQGTLERGWWCKITGGHWSYPPRSCDWNITRQIGNVVTNGSRISIEHVNNNGSREPLINGLPFSQVSDETIHQLTMQYGGTLERPWREWLCELFGGSVMYMYGNVFCNWTEA